MIYILSDNFNIYVLVFYSINICDISSIRTSVCDFRKVTYALGSVTIATMDLYDNYEDQILNANSLMVILHNYI